MKQWCTLLLVLGIFAAVFSVFLGAQGEEELSISVAILSAGFCVSGAILGAKSS